MLKLSAYPTPRSPSAAPVPGAPAGPSYKTPAPKAPGLYETFQRGVDSVRNYRKPGLKAQESDDLLLTRAQWMEKYPHGSPQEAAQAYINWRQSVQRRRKPRRQNWMQKAFWPLNKLLPPMR